MAQLALSDHKSDDINMASVWACSRNDIAANCGVLLAAVGVWMVGTGWPDLVIAILLASLFIVSATRVLNRAVRELRVPLTA